MPTSPDEKEVRPLASDQEAQETAGERVPSSLTPSEAARLTELEQVVAEHLDGFFAVGNALAEIRDSRLYREVASSFEMYARDQWGISGSHAHRLVEAAQVTHQLVSADLPAPANEAQARALTKVPAEDRAEVWQTTLEQTGGKPTAAAVESVVTGHQKPKAPMSWRVDGAREAWKREKALRAADDGDQKNPEVADTVATFVIAGDHKTPGTLSGELDAHRSPARTPAATRTRCGTNGLLCEAEPDHTDEILDRIAELAVENLNDETIGKKLGLSTARVHQLGEQHNIRVRQKAGGRDRAEVPSWSMEVAIRHIDPEMFGNWFDEFRDEYTGAVDPADFAKLDPACIPSWLARLDASIEHLQAVRQSLAAAGGEDR